jgi:hypothetical protein
MATVTVSRTCSPRVPESARLLSVVREAVPVAAYTNENPVSARNNSAPATQGAAAAARRDARLLTVNDPGARLGWESFCRDMAKAADGTLDSLVLDAPGLLYIVVNGKVREREDAVELLSRMQAFARSARDTRHTPALVLTPAMYQRMLHSLHLETPFNAFRSAGTGDADVTGTPRERRLHCFAQKRAYLPPDDELMHLLIRETIAIMSISVRMLERFVPLSNNHKLTYLYGRVPALRLALEKGEIAAPFMENTLSCYRTSYPESSGWIDDVGRKYLSLSVAEINALSPLDLFYDNYPQVKSILDEVNSRLGEEHGNHS